MRLLVVDDNRDDMLVLGLLLKSEGYIVHVAENGAEALKLIQSFRPDVALLDLWIPGSSGFAIAAALKRRYRDACPVLIAVTGHGEAENHEQAEMSGFQHFMTKPYDPKTLLKLLASLRSKKN